MQTEVEQLQTELPLRAPPSSYEKVDDVDKRSLEIAQVLSTVTAEVNSLWSKLSIASSSVSAEAASKLRYKCEGHIDALMKLLETLDAIPSEGDQEFRQRRKGVVVGIQDIISQFEALSRRVAQIISLITNVQSTTSLTQVQQLGRHADTKRPNDETDSCRSAGDAQSDTARLTDDSNETSSRANTASPLPSAPAHPSATRPRPAQAGDVPVRQRPPNPATDQPIRKQVRRGHGDALSHFSPASQLVDNVTHYLALLELPHFRTSDISLRTASDDNGDKLLTVSGTSMLNSRFEKTFLLPLDADLDRARGRFEGNILHIAIPKIPHSFEN